MIKKNILQDTYIIYDDQSIILRKGNLDNIICSNSHSAPSINKSNDKLIYISPFEWEQLGSLMLYDLNLNKLSKLEICIPQNFTIKKVEWLNDFSILLIVGFAYGTVSVGGDLYTYNFFTKNLKKILELNKNEEIKDFEITDNKIYLEKVIFDTNFDKNYIEKISIERNDIND